MLVIGLTGGVGCGKSTVCDIFANLGASIIDTDIIAKQLVTPDSEALKEISTTFGNKVINQDGSLNRRLMRDIIFNEDSKKQKLESILHPKIYNQVKQELRNATGIYCIVAIPLLFETQHLFKNIIDRVLVVITSNSAQQERLMLRDNISLEDANKMINSQSSNEDKLSIANDIIYNNSSIDSLKSKVQELHHVYQSFFKM